MDARPDLICFSHLRWDFVFQRPHHLLTRAARDRRVYFVEEPILDGVTPHLTIRSTKEGVTVVTPVIPAGTDNLAIPSRQRTLLAQLVNTRPSRSYALWFSTPMAMAFAWDLQPAVVVYDCMDDLASFQGAPANMATYEAQLMAAADVVFTGGRSLYLARRGRHPNLHEFPSAVDAAHFARARKALEPDDQRALPGPRVGFFGVIDERLDVELLAGLADLRRDLQLIMIGPVVKIDPAILPRRPNIHWLGRRSYDELPAYLAGWDVAMLPFARNAATRHISPTKTPEYLAAGRPVVSTSIADVVDPYQAMGLVHIADTPPAFSAAIDAAMAEDPFRRRVVADHWLERLSWDATWERMDQLIEAAAQARNRQPALVAS